MWEITQGALIKRKVFRPRPHLTYNVQVIKMLFGGISTSRMVGQMILTKILESRKCLL